MRDHSGCLILILLNISSLCLLSFVHEAGTCSTQNEQLLISTGLTYIVHPVFSFKRLSTSEYFQIRLPYATFLAADSSSSSPNVVVVVVVVVCL